MTDSASQTPPPDRLQRDLMRGSADLMVLSVLAEGPRYGYMIQKRIAEVSSNLVKLQAGTLYPLLHRLEADGAITSQWESDTGRDRKWYALTPAGQRRLHDQADQWEQYVATIRGLLQTALGARPAPEA